MKRVLCSLLVAALPFGSVRFRPTTTKTGKTSDEHNYDQRGAPS